jgi:hypothetical protein
MKILNIVGARLNLVKIAPFLTAMLSNDHIKPFPVQTGQHYDEKLSGIFFEQMGIRRPDINLDAGSRSPSLAAIVSNVFLRRDPTRNDNPKSFSIAARGIAPAPAPSSRAVGTPASDLGRSALVTSSNIWLLSWLLRYIRFL